MSSNKRELSYGLAINEAFRQMMARDKSIFLIGQGVKSPWYVGDTTKGLLEEFGDERVIDTPVSENAITGAAVGAALTGLRPVVVHPRMDFMLYALDPIVNEAANWHYMFGGESSVPMVIWGIINRGGEQAAQHSQALHALFAHIPGLKVVMPATPYDAKGLMISAIMDDNPVVYVDDRWLYHTSGEVPREPYTVPIGRGIVRKEGKDCTLLATSHMVIESVTAAAHLMKVGIDVEVIDVRSVKPIDEDLIYASVRKTGRLVIADGGWKTCGFAAELSARAAEDVFEFLQAPIIRMTLPDAPAPASSALEENYFCTARNIIDLIKQFMKDAEIISPHYQILGV